MDTLLGDPSKLGWRAETSFASLVKEMVEVDIEAARRDALMYGFQCRQRHAYQICMGPATIRSSEVTCSAGADSQVPRSEGGDAEVVVWGTGTPRREFLHVDDLADACLFMMRHTTVNSR